MSICLAIGMCTQPIGQLLYGYLFEILKNNNSLIIFGAFLVGGIIAFISKKVFSKLEPLGELNGEGLTMKGGIIEKIN